MTTADIIALCAALPTLIAAIATAVVSILNWRKANAKITEVHGLVSNLVTEEKGKDNAA